MDLGPVAPDEREPPRRESRAARRRSRAATGGSRPRAPTCRCSRTPPPPRRPRPTPRAAATTRWCAGRRARDRARRRGLRDQRRADARVAQLPDHAVEQEVVQVHRRRDEQRETRVEREHSERARREQPRGHDPERGADQDRRAQIAERRAARRRGEARRARVVDRDPQVLHGVRDRDPDERERGRVPSGRTAREAAAPRAPAR